MKNFITTIIVILTLSLTSYSQPWGPGGPDGGGPPPPPDNYCQQFPDDPACGGNTAVPVSSTEGMIIFMFLSGIFFYYKMNGNSFKFKKL
jgi:hypothetical protein